MALLLGVAVGLLLAVGDEVVVGEGLVLRDVVAVVDEVGVMLLLMLKVGDGVAVGAMPPGHTQLDSRNAKLSGMCC